MTAWWTVEFILEHSGYTVTDILKQHLSWPVNSLHTNFKLLVEVQVQAGGLF